MAEKGEKLDALLRGHVVAGTLPPVYTEHPVAVASSMQAQPLALYMDGVPTTKRDGVLGIWVYFLLSDERHLCCVIKKSRLCKCGCRGWHSLFKIFLWLAWSLLTMATGDQPFGTWDQESFTDAIRLGLVGSQLLFRAALCAIKGDWQEFCSTFGFANWKTANPPCYGCWATVQNYLKDATLAPGSETVWNDFTMADYFEACRMCEIIVHVRDMELLRRIKSSLFYDHRQNGSHGRAMRWGIVGTPIEQGDRLEPTPDMPNVSTIDSLALAQLPVRLVFWRSNQSRVKHRNPIFNPDIGITPVLLGVDQLHALNLGALQKFARELMWIMVWCSIWGNRSGDQQNWIAQSLIVMRSELKLWEERYRRAHPEHKATEIQQITSGHIGVPRSRYLKLKAAETKFFFWYLHETLKRVWGRVHQGKVWLASADSMSGLLEALSVRPWKLTLAQEQDYPPPSRLWAMSAYS